MNFLRKLTAEGWLVIAMIALSLLLLIFMNSVVAQPKLLFGRSLTAISPKLFPTIALGALLLFATLLLITRRVALFGNVWKTGNRVAVTRAILLFVVMLFYALTLKPLGFIISSALAVASISWLAGNRSVPLLLSVSLISPLAIYLLATRGLAVSLPELDWIELAIAKALGS